MAITNKILKEQLKKRISVLQIEEKRQKKVHNRYSNIRLLVFLVGVLVGGHYYLQDSFQEAYLPLVCCSIVFLFLVNRHGKNKVKLEQIGYKILINQQYMARMTGEWIFFKDAGQDFVDDKDPCTSDLDIFGAKSLFQWLTVAYTFYGRKILSTYLRKPDKDKVTLAGRQQGVAELAGKMDFCQEMQCIGMSFPKVSNNPGGILADGEDIKKISKSQWLLRSCYFLPIATFASIILRGLEFSIPVYVPVSLLAIQLVLTIVGYFKITPVLEEIYRIKDDISVFSHLLQLIEEETFSQPLLVNLKENLGRNQQSSVQQIKRLKRIIDFIDVRYSSILYFVLNVCFLWDYHCVFQVLSWQEANKDKLGSWLETIGTFEALASLAVVLQLNPEWVFPDFSDDTVQFKAEQIGHPLIGEEKRICNSVVIDHEVGVITGSNMSGKTTFLRTVGINLVLAYAGTVVCARKMECSIMDVFTSMRVADDVSSGISTFYAELLRIKMMVDHSHTQKKMIFLIDEIFRGTNSRDRIIGARNVIKNLHKDWIIGLISTHDLELCELEEEENGLSKNYHFEEKFIENEMKFDYQLRLGRSTTTNAQYLMKMVGIVLVE